MPQDKEDWIRNITLETERLTFKRYPKLEEALKDMDIETLMELDQLMKNIAIETQRDIGQFVFRKDSDEDEELLD